MPDIDDINAQIISTASDGIASATVGNQTTTVLSIDEQIKAANHTAAQSASGKGHFGLRFTTLVPPECG